MAKINVKDTEITIISVDERDYISLTDMANAKGSESRAADIIKNWIRTRYTLEFLGTWEQINNPSFKVVEFDHFKMQAGLPSFVLSVSEWIGKTNAIGIIVRKGNIRDYATINELICLSNMENLNAVFINEKIPQKERLIKLNKIAIQQMSILQDVERRKLLKGEQLPSVTTNSTDTAFGR